MTKQALSYADRYAKERAKLIAAITLEMGSCTPEWIQTARVATLHRLYRIITMYRGEPSSTYSMVSMIEFLGETERARQSASKWYSHKLDT